MLNRGLGQTRSFRVSVEEPSMSGCSSLTIHADQGIHVQSKRPARGTVELRVVSTNGARKDEHRGLS